MTSAKIVSMHENHLGDVAQIEQLTSATPWSADVFLKEINSPTHILLVSCIEDSKEKQIDTVNGFCGGQMIGDELHIHSLAVDPNSRRHGIARELILDLLGVAKSRQAQKATLEVRISNQPAITLYESLGFTHSSIRQKYYRDNGEDAYIMWLDEIKVARS